MRVLGIDTSNYTCSAALYDSAAGQMVMEKQLLSTPKGSLGLRQSQAVFEHVKSVGPLWDRLFAKSHGPVGAVGVSSKPRSIEGSYMPCFLAGKMAAQALSAAMAIPMYEFSHQQGHIAAALFSCGKIGWLTGKTFLAFHVSGGTTECLLVKTEDGTICSMEVVGSSLDLKAGQAVDRVGKSLGLPFPAGPYLEQLALQCEQKFNPRISLKGLDCCLSGLENQCRALQKQGRPDAAIARYCLQFIQDTLDCMVQAAQKKYGPLPLLFAGGVMSNTIIRKSLSAKYNASFAQPEFSADNAGGIALLAANREETCGALHRIPD